MDRLGLELRLEVVEEVVLAVHCSLASEAEVGHYCQALEVAEEHRHSALVAALVAELARWSEVRKLRLLALASRWIWEFRLQKGVGAVPLCRTE